ncbi:MAG TPA: ATP phosphoribosyltransferase regulatory subunit [Thermoanaerobaculia bacterium]
MANRNRYPTGVQPLLIEETARRRRIEARFVEVLERAGFAEVVLPIIDYAEPYALLQARDVSRQSYRFIDREGELVAIRSDFTPMVARALAPSIAQAGLPLRVFYRGDVIRCDDSRLGANREMFQIGAEIIGDDSTAADIEILTLDAGLVREFGMKPTVVYTDVAAALPALRPVLSTKRMTAEVPSALRGVAEKFIAGTAALEDIAPFAPEAASRLAAIAAAVPDFEMHLDDFDESGGYYSGLRFRVYDGTSRSKLAQGGRYDRLYETFGTPAAAVGFTFTIDDLD